MQRRARKRARTHAPDVSLHKLSSLSLIVTSNLKKLKTGDEDVVTRAAPLTGVFTATPAASAEVAIRRVFCVTMKKKIAQMFVKFAITVRRRSQKERTRKGKEGKGRERK